MLKLLQTSYAVLRTSSTRNGHLGITSRSFYECESIPPPEERPKYEVCKDEKLWQYVDRLLPDKMIPKPPMDGRYLPSGWKPQKMNPNAPYIIQRTRNHMLPVFLRIRQRGQKRRTVIKNVFGDIGRLGKDLHGFIQKIYPHKVVAVKVHEMTGKVIIHGDHVNNVKLWLERRNY